MLLTYIERFYCNLYFNVKSICNVKGIYNWKGLRALPSFQNVPNLSNYNICRLPISTQFNVLATDYIIRVSFTH